MASRGVSVAILAVRLPVVWAANSPCLRMLLSLPWEHSGTISASCATSVAVDLGLRVDFLSGKVSPGEQQRDASLEAQSSWPSVKDAKV